MPITHKLSGYRSGFSTAVPIDTNIEAVSNYMQKYITKDMPLIDNKKRYWCSAGLVRPETTANGVSKFALRKIIWNHTPTYVTEEMEVQDFVKQPHTPYLSESSTDQRQLFA